MYDIDVVIVQHNTKESKHQLTMLGPRSIAKLAYKYNFTRVYGSWNYS